MLSGTCHYNRLIRISQREMICHGETISSENCILVKYDKNWKPEVIGQVLGGGNVRQNRSFVLVVANVVD
jgi:hypothetical protein